MIQRILDDNDVGTIVLFNEDDEEVEFEQIATIQYRNELYTILKPVEEMEGVAEDEAIVFHVDCEDGSDDVLSIVVDDVVIDAVFDIYYELLDENGNDE